ncbi:CinA family protein [Teredinibacter turnerae]|uniref:CinA family protein n=1 Tax=Teredinibacter turnerae TaxID=2426 RepID=UPI0005F84ED1|nr:nicotinamide-nucleotide amidohydrolase family protein [Teredinibacter turnerae]
MKTDLTAQTLQLSQSLATLLAKAGERVTFAESCTGGSLAQAVTEIPGSSGWFDLGLVTYSNAMKQSLLGVSKGLLDRHGAVSESVVVAMARGALAASGATLAAATSGIAGPDGGTDQKPVGTVCFAWGAAGDLRSSTQLFSGDRSEVRVQATNYALRVLLDYLQQKHRSTTV